MGRRYERRGRVERFLFVLFLHLFFCRLAKLGVKDEVKEEDDDDDNDSVWDAFDLDEDGNPLENDEEKEGDDAEEMEDEEQEQKKSEERKDKKVGYCCALR